MAARAIKNEIRAMQSLREIQDGYPNNEKKVFATPSSFVGTVYGQLV